ncbi:oligopeptide/dipeptide ABC transporter ATP-binding protein [Streptomyces sp. NPDC005349]|uniref:oligopeptide/dipeptide ABC transporter ATP-binding protein n=1 Tax=Streptomyces sp. NPDC005349 TaxID=3157037 RepID=UPI0033A31687
MCRTHALFVARLLASARWFVRRVSSISTRTLGRTEPSSPYLQDEEVAQANLSPGAAGHLLATDLGYDLLGRLMAAGRTSLEIGLAAGLLATPGETPSAAEPRSGCRFRTRCPLAQDVCAEVEPPVAAPRGAGHQVACHLPLPVPEEVAAQPV